MFPKLLIQSLLALYGFGQSGASRRRHPGPILIGRPSGPRFP